MKSGGIWTPVVLAACVASVAGWGPIRRAEQALGPMLSIGEALFAPLAHAPAGTEVVDDHRREADLAWASYVEAVRGPGEVCLPGRKVALAPVLSVATTERRRRMKIAVPADGVPDGALVTHRGAFVGLVVDVEDRIAEVALIGDEDLRPLAAEWQTAPSARPVHFLLGSEKGTALVESRSSTVAPPAGQVAWTRSVAALGDDLPPGLLLGRVVKPDEQDLPGGAAEGLGATRELELEPLIAADDLGIVTVEVLPSAEREARTVSALRVVTSGSETTSVRLDVGSRHGVEQGCWVVRDGAWLGRVAVVGWTSSIVEREVPRGTLLVIGAGGSVVPCRTEAASWPEGWVPQVGDRVVTGHGRLGGLLMGTVKDVTQAGFDVEPVVWGTDRTVTVVER